MIKILVISDTHGETSWVYDLLLSHSDYDYFFHLGDSELPAYMLSPFISVKGNCDYYNDYPPTKRIITKNATFHLEHGNHYIDDKYILAQDVLIFLHGHSHKHYVRKIDDNHYVANPGSYSRPRDGSEGTYLEILINDNGEVTFNFKDRIKSQL